MFKETSYTNRLTFFQKIRSIDLILIFCVLILGGISTFAMYSSEGGRMLYYTKSHLLRFSVFFVLMIFFWAILMMFYLNYIIKLKFN